MLVPLLLLNLNAHAVEYAEALSLATLLEEADDAVHGRVVAAQHEWGDDGLIYTRVTMSAVDRLADGLQPRLTTFLVPGGQMDDVVLTIPGSPTFEMGNDYLVFVKGQQLIGLGQGAFTIEGRSARRSVPSDHETVPLTHVFGSPQEARSCSVEALQAAFEEGWSLRKNTMLRLGADAGRAMEVTLLEGVEYSVHVCGDDEGQGVGFELVDSNERVIAQSATEDTDTTARFFVPSTGSYWLVAYNDAWPLGRRRAVDISIRYR